MESRLVQTITFGPFMAQAEGLVKIQAASILKDPQLVGAPDDAILSLAKLALQCVAIPTSSRPRMRDVVVLVEGLRGKYFGFNSNKHSAKVDNIMKRKIEVSLSLELSQLGEKV